MKFSPAVLWLQLFISISIILSGGCSTLGAPAQDDRLDLLPASGKNSVYALFINSPLDVPQLGRLAQVAAYFRSRGFTHSNFLSHASGPDLAARIRNIRLDHPDARIALIGWSGASLWIWDALTELNQSNETIELVVYLDSNWIKTRVAEHGHPGNFRRAVLIYRSDNPPVIGVPHSVIRQAGTEYHLAVAAHPDTVGFLSEELARLARE